MQYTKKMINRAEIESCRLKHEDVTDSIKTEVLVHGFFRSKRDMRYLEEKLKERGYRVFAPTLPAIFGNVRECSDLLTQMIEENVLEEGVMHFVGHSMGGLVIRDYLSRRIVKKLGRVVMMGTPNGGSPYANLLLKIPFLKRILKALPDIEMPGLDIDAPLNNPSPDIGIIIGETDILRKCLIPGDHDGLVGAASVRRITAIDELRVPFCHERIHWRPDTVEAVVSFLETGKFNRI